MIAISKLSKEEYNQCTSCQCDNETANIYQIQIGKTERQTMTIKLCSDCMIDLVNALNDICGE